MAGTKIYQLVSGFRAGDAISNEAVLLKSLAERNGHESHIYCPTESTAHKIGSQVHDIDGLAAVIKADDMALLHLSIGNRSNVIFESLDCRKAILYHNITPPHFFERLNPALAQVLEEGRKKLTSMASTAEVNLAVSAYNASELVGLGYRDVKVFPLAIDAEFGHGEVSAGMKQKLTRDGRENILFVGRVVPNKRFDKLIEVFSYYQLYVNPNCRLVLAGSSSGQESYKSMLLGVAYSLDAKNVVFTEYLKAAELNACYATASAFLCMSDHEGFCAPLIEAMAWDVPIFANSAAAIPETLDGAGVLFENADSATIAETMGRVLHSPELKEAVLDRQRKRLAQYRARDVWAEFSGLLGI